MYFFYCTTDQFLNTNIGKQNNKEMNNIAKDMLSVSYITVQLFANILDKANTNTYALKTPLIVL